MFDVGTIWIVEHVENVDVIAGDVGEVPANEFQITLDSVGASCSPAEWTPEVPMKRSSFASSSGPQTARSWSISAGRTSASVQWT